MITLSVPYALEYCGYLIERTAAIGDTEIAALDMTVQVEHFTSMGALEPIYSSGFAAKYRILTADVPQWLIDGLAIEHDNAIRLAVEIVTANTQCHRDWYTALRYLAIDPKPGKFSRSLIDQFTAKGTLSPKQYAAVIAGPAQFSRRY